MGKSSSGLSAVPFTIRLSVVDGGWVTMRAKEKETTVNEIFRQLVEDARTLYGFPEPLRDKLAADAKRLGKALDRDYLLYLLGKRYEELVHEDVEKARDGRKR